MPKNINCINIMMTLEGTEEKKKAREQSDEIYQRCKEIANKLCKWSLEILITVYIVRLFDSHFFQ